MAVIGGLLLVIGGELIAGRVGDIVLVLRTSWLSAAATILTFLATTQLALQYAIFLGAGLSILLHAVAESRRGRLAQLIPDGDGPWHTGSLNPRRKSPAGAPPFCTMPAAASSPR
ncbi:hypothetical protein V2W30_39550 (plasmid) [Streptomyces sp. Q6]|uniref:Uncharacterized protein n=1 Tax=Streptomyces citrinus TaxID=3118173 RepID=A0ACD5AQ02_9ACTN